MNNLDQTQVSMLKLERSIVEDKIQKVKKFTEVSMRNHSHGAIKMVNKYCAIKFDGKDIKLERGQVIIPFGDNRVTLFHKGHVAYKGTVKYIEKYHNLRKQYKTLSDQINQVYQIARSNHINP